MDSEDKISMSLWNSTNIDYEDRVVRIRSPNNDLYREKMRKLGELQDAHKDKTKKGCGLCGWFCNLYTNYLHDNRCLHSWL